VLIQSNCCFRQSREDSLMKITVRVHISSIKPLICLSKKIVHFLFECVYLVCCKLFILHFFLKFFTRVYKPLLCSWFLSWLIVYTIGHVSKLVKIIFPRWIKWKPATNKEGLKLATMASWDNDNVMYRCKQSLCVSEDQSLKISSTVCTVRLFACLSSLFSCMRSYFSFLSCFVCARSTIFARLRSSIFCPPPSFSTLYHMNTWIWPIQCSVFGLVMCSEK